VRCAGGVRALTRPKMVLNTSILIQTPSPVVLCMRSVLNTSGLAVFAGVVELCIIGSLKSGPGAALTRPLPQRLLPSRPVASAAGAKRPRAESRSPRLGPPAPA
jgi:hypothetical protein